MMIVMDNLSIHTKEEVRRVIEEAGHLVRTAFSGLQSNRTYFLGIEGVDEA